MSGVPTSLEPSIDGVWAVLPSWVASGRTENSLLALGCPRVSPAASGRVKQRLGVPQVGVGWMEWPRSSLISSSSINQAAMMGEYLRPTGTQEPQ